MISLIGIATAYFHLASQVDRAMEPGNNEIISVDIPLGSSLDRIGIILSDHNLISSQLAFKMESKKDGYAGSYKAGMYQLNKNMTMREIMDSIYHGESEQNVTRFTIPEGFDINRIVDRLETIGLIDRESFLWEVENGDFDYLFLENIPKDKNRLEGFLYPETYEVYVGASAHDIIDKMLKQFHNLFTDQYYSRVKELRMTVREIVTLASIIEREAIVQEDRPMISSAFHNRLSEGMRLQSCATVQYILGEQKLRLTIADTKIESPYNTYLYEGLPPSPIANPRIESIHAALWPADTNYYYFLAKGDGSHVFAETYDEFLALKRKYIK